jgi:hypothetical protein
MRARKELGIKTLYAPSIVGVHNDWAGWTFADYCRRQRIYANTDFYFWQKYGDEHPRLQMVLESLPINLSEDNIKLLSRKITKQIFANRVSQSLLLQLSLGLESKPLFRPLLWRIYKMVLSGAVHNGFREGMRSQFEK